MTKTLWQLSLLLAAVGLLAFGTSQPAAASAGGWDILGEHTIKYGETLYCIGRAYGVDPWAIATQNDVTYANLIHPGVLLDIPNVPATLPAGPVCAAQFGDAPDPVPEPVQPTTCGGCICRWTHTVKWGHTLSWVSIYYGVDMYSIAECNCIYDLNYIRSGDSLCIP
jgi:LysM domain